MTDITEALQAKSDQLNAADIMGCDLCIKIRAVDVKKGEQPVSVYFDGDNNKPWKPSKGMLRILATAWGVDSANWIGKSALLYFEPTVTYGGKEVGGIRIKALSDIDELGLKCSLTISRTKREPYHVPRLEVQATEYPDERFKKALPVMAKMMQDGEMSLQQVIAKCQQTGQLTAEQLAELELQAPIDATDNNEDFEL